MRTGSADLPLHGGHCPPELFEKMKKLSGAIVEVILLEFSRQELLRRFAEPGWFQALGCVLGFDWHSSGLTTVLCGALKESLNPRAAELGLYVAGGKGATSRKTPDELENYVNSHAPSLPLESLQKFSKLAAKVDSSAVQDNYQLYHHCFFLTEDGDWAVVQQGMNDDNNRARRYHWLSDSVVDFIEEPHSGICTVERHSPLNLTSEASRENREISTELISSNPSETLRDYQLLLDYWDEEKKTLNLPDRHDVPRVNHLEKVLGELYEKPPEDYEALLERKGIGPKTVRALSMVAEVIWGAKPSYEDPARYSFAHGGKDGYPYPVDHKRYNRTLELLNTAIGKAKINRSDKKEAFERLAELSKQTSN